MTTTARCRTGRWQIEEGLTRCALVHCGFDNDAGGNKLWGQMTEVYPRAEAIERERPPPWAKDWNDALRSQDQRQGQTNDQKQGREGSPEQGRKGSGHDDILGRYR